uniref:Putative ovule protein n=1 Tax=Solanum chacoense TaxID=4108 RepID=A0A0V0GPH6_SOLCH
MAYTREIKDMYDTDKTRVRTMGGDSEHFPVVMRLHQKVGFFFSQSLFLLFLLLLVISCDQTPLMGLHWICCGPAIFCS